MTDATLHLRVSGNTGDAHSPRLLRRTPRGLESRPPARVGSGIGGLLLGPWRPLLGARLAAAESWWFWRRGCGARPGLHPQPHFSRGAGRRAGLHAPGWGTGGTVGVFARSSRVGLTRGHHPCPPRHRLRQRVLSPIVGGGGREQPLTFVQPSLLSALSLGWVS